jgi:hypothetical protein
METKEKLYDLKVMKMNGAKHHFIKLLGESSWKLHNWDGPAIEPVDKDCKLKKEYYLNGIKYTEKSYKETLKSREGLPFYKQSSFKGSNNRY